MLNSPRLALIGRYPLLVGYIRQLLDETFPHFRIDTFESPVALNHGCSQDLVIFLQDRDTDPSLVTLLHSTRNSRWQQRILVLSEQRWRWSLSLPSGLVLEDMAIGEGELRVLLGRLVTEGMDQLLGMSGTTALHTLTPREWKVLSHLRHGVSNKVIARRMALTESTVKFHMSKLFVKTGCENRIRMALLAGELVGDRELGGPSAPGRSGAADDQPWRQQDLAGRRSDGFQLL